MPDPTPYFTVEEFQARYPDDDVVAELTDDQIDAARVLAEEMIEGLETEDGTHIAWVPRVETFTYNGPEHGPLVIPRYRIREIQAISFDGVEQSLTNVHLNGGAISGRSWPRGTIAVTVEHGAESPPAEIKDAALILAYNRAVKGPIDDRATGTLSPGGEVITLATPGLRGAVTGIPVVDQAIARYRKPRIVQVSRPVTSLHERHRHGFRDVWDHEAR